MSENVQNMKYGNKWNAAIKQNCKKTILNRNLDASEQDKRGITSKRIENDRRKASNLA